MKSAEEASKLSKEMQDILFRLENSPKPFVAAIMGSCMGGGLETAMACHYRVAVDGMKTALSVPEVMLGLLPGGGQQAPTLMPFSIENCCGLFDERNFSLQVAPSGCPS